MKSFVIMVFTALLVLNQPVLASDVADQVIQRATRDCHSFENGVLKVSAKAISRIDVTNDGQPDEIIDAHHFECSSAASLFCGTGGCSVTVIVDGKPTEFLAKGWGLVEWANQPIILLAVHGSRCGGTNIHRCFQALVWSEGAFRRIGK